MRRIATRRPPIRQPGFASTIFPYERVDICVSVLHFFHLLQLASYLTFQSSVQISDFLSVSIYHAQPNSPPFYLPLNRDTPIFVKPNPPTPKIIIMQSPLPVKIVHQFPLGTWLENLAILTSSELFQVDAATYSQS